MPNQVLSDFPLFEKIVPKTTIRRALDLTILFLLLCLLFYRLLSLQSHGITWFLALLCESFFTFIWVLIICTKWTPMHYRTFPRRLQNRFRELPAVDMFVTTADTNLEPPINTVNTVLSLLAVDYPAHKLACYVSDDGCSPITFYSLVEASKLANHWVPFCKKYNIPVRAPFRYFSGESAPASAGSWEFQQDWKKMKEEYEKLCGNIEHAAENFAAFDLTGEFAVFSNTERQNHQTIVKVIRENKEHLSNGIPHLIYISREKWPKYPHHYKAGAMNVLARVSGLMTNAPFMLNVDCDMYANNPEIFLQAMCLLLGFKNERDCGFVQVPQLYYNAPEDSLTLLHEYIGKGIAGIQGPFYTGSGTFHRRKVIYGLWPDEIESQGKMGDDELLKKFGNSKEFIESVAHALKGKTGFPTSNLLNSLDAAHQVAGCGYEYGSDWGKNVGCLYGAIAEDMLTGLMIHKKGWRSGYCSPDPPGFLGCGPPDGPSVMKQQKRWATGLVEILFSKNNPIFATLTAKLQFRQCLAYLWILTWGLRCVPELCYTALPAYCIITNSNFLPKIQELGIWIPIAVLVIYKLYNLSEYILSRFSILSWWVNNRQARIIATSAWLYGLVNAVLKLLGLSETIFEVTKKIHQSSASSTDVGQNDDKLIFDDSPVFIPGTTILLVHLTALATGLLGLQPQAVGQGSGHGEFLCSLYVVLCFWPFMEGLFRKGEYGIPLPTIFKSAALAILFVQLCKI